MRWFYEHAVQNQAESLARTVLPHRGGEVIIDEIGAGRRRVSIVPRDAPTFVPCRSCETSYPLELLRRLLEVHGLAWLCDAIRRDESTIT